ISTRRNTSRSSELSSRKGLSHYPLLTHWEAWIAHSTSAKLLLSQGERNWYKMIPLQLPHLVHNSNTAVAMDSACLLPCLQPIFPRCVVIYCAFSSPVTT
uniref:Ovule protein n=1 Tax=Mesocestoides corti TaxID=53468 RepID=A0A5K3FCT7_MESCO